ncbi:MAG: TetR/AcrR family transcriptional regulator [Sinimarinibacterium sp.]|jgi:AcrR family transcriptional regulator
MPTLDAKKPGRPRKLTRDRIVRAAIEVLEYEGFGALTMRALAQRLGVNHATLYNYVGHIEDIENEALASLTSRVPIPSVDRPEPLRQQLIEHLLAIRDLQLQHPHMVHAPVGSPTWRSHMKITNQVLRALTAKGGSVVESAVAYNVLVALMATSAERARSTHNASPRPQDLKYFEIERQAILALPEKDSDLIRKPLEQPQSEAAQFASFVAVLDHLINRLLPGLK